WPYRLIESCIKLGSFPLEGYRHINVLPVDYTVKALVHLSCQSDLKQDTFHLYNPDTLDFRQIFRTYNRLFVEDKPLQGVAINKWLKKIKQAVESGQELSIYPLLHQYIASMDKEESQPKKRSVTH